MTKKATKYYEAVGRRKNAIARVRISEADKGAKYIVNGTEMKEYFPILDMQDIATAPLRATAKEEGVSISVIVSGGGKAGQVEAVRLGVSRALVKLDSDFSRTLKDLDYLRRDSRKKERKKAGLKKARRAPQWQKR